MATVGSGNTITINVGSQVATTYHTNSGNAVPAANILNVVGDGIITTSALGNTITINSGSPTTTTFMGNSGPGATPM